MVAKDDGIVLRIERSGHVFQVRYRPMYGIEARRCVIQWMMDSRLPFDYFDAHFFMMVMDRVEAERKAVGES